MRKLLLVTGVLLGGALFTGSSASAKVGCMCLKLGAAPVCVSSVAECNRVVGGICIAPCDYRAPKKVERHYKPRKVAKPPHKPRKVTKRRPPPKSMKKPPAKGMKKPPVKKTK